MHQWKGALHVANLESQYRCINSYYSSKGMHQIQWSDSQDSSANMHLMSYGIINSLSYSARIQWHISCCPLPHQQLPRHHLPPSWNRKSAIWKMAKKIAFSMKWSLFSDPVTNFPPFSMIHIYGTEYAHPRIQLYIHIRFYVHLWGGWRDDRLMGLIQTAGAWERKERINTYT